MYRRMPRPQDIRLTRLALRLGAIMLVAPVSLAAQHESHAATRRDTGHERKLGTVNFANSGSRPAQEPFRLGIALLHSYEYQDARAAFRDAERAHPKFALAYWGEAPTQSQFDWGSEDLPLARAALERLAPTRDQRLAMAGAARERAFGEGVETFLAGGPPPLERARTFADAMQAYAAAAPSDVEAMAFAAR